MSPLTNPVTSQVTQLTGARLRPLVASDAASIAEHANDRRVWRNLRDRFPHPYSERDALDFITVFAARSPCLHFGIEVDDAVVGVIGLEPKSDVERHGAEIGYWIGPHYWGRGITTEALRAVTAYGHRELGLLRVFALAFAWNRASIRVLEKADFVFEGRMRAAIVKDGEIVDALMHAHVQLPDGQVPPSLAPPFS